MAGVTALELFINKWSMHAPSSVIEFQKPLGSEPKPQAMLSIFLNDFKWEKEKLEKVGH